MQGGEASPGTWGPGTVPGSRRPSSVCLKVEEGAGDGGRGDLSRVSKPFSACDTQFAFERAVSGRKLLPLTVSISLFLSPHAKVLSLRCGTARPLPPQELCHVPRGAVRCRRHPNRAGASMPRTWALTLGSHRGFGGPRSRSVPHSPTAGAWRDIFILNYTSPRGSLARPLFLL